MHLVICIPLIRLRKKLGAALTLWIELIVFSNYMLQAFRHVSLCSPVDVMLTATKVDQVGLNETSCENSVGTVVRLHIERPCQD
jgi:hypothetical protein